LSIVLWVRTGPSGCNLSNLFQNTDKAVITVLERASSVPHDTRVVAYHSCFEMTLY
jgi:hypothetical protein